MADPKDNRQFGHLTENPYRSQFPSNTPTDSGQYASASPTSGCHPQLENHPLTHGVPREPVEPPPKSTASGIIISFLCWGFFLAISIFIAVSHHLHVPVVGEVSPRAELFQLIFGAKLMVGMKTFTQEATEPKTAFKGTGIKFTSVRNMQANSVLFAEMNSLAAASELLDQLESQATVEEYHFSDSEKQVSNILRRIYGGVDYSELNQLERGLLKKELLWFGKLALNLQRKENAPLSTERRKLLGDAQSKLITFVVAVLIGILAFVGGLIGLIIFLALYFKRKLHIRTEHYTQHATIYIEAAAGWLLTYFAMGLLLGRLVPFFDPLLTNIAVSAISFMFAVFWPIIRGVRIDAFLKDIGFVGNVVVESCIGLISYVSCLPILAAGYLVTMIAIFVAGPTLQEGGLSSPSGPGHPIVEWISEGSISTIALVFIMTCVCAPLLEETVFRGLMYRNLRDNTFRAGHFVSVTLSALVNGFIFAAIHPQGILFIPMLGALALSFSIVREWRGSLIAPMTMHAIHNGLVTSFLLFVMMD